jgi:hypothetical protein
VVVGARFGFGASVLLFVCVLVMTQSSAFGLDLVDTIAPPTDVELGFGWAVDMNGPTLAVGNPWANKAYVYEWDGSAWRLGQTLGPGGSPAEGADFGWAVAADLETVVVGSRFGEAQQGTWGAGAVHVFERGTGAWTPVQRLSPPNPRSFDHFGEAVAIDGDWLVAGAPWQPEGEFDGPGEPGAVYVFRRTDTGWTLAQTLAAPDTAGFDRFGAAVAIDGEEIAVEAPYADSGGAVYIFRFGGSQWDYVQRMSHLGGLADMDDGVLVTSSVHDRTVYVFGRTAGAWHEEARLESTAPDIAFGMDASVSGDLIAVGAAREDTANGVNAGAAYLYQHADGTWDLMQRWEAWDGIEWAFFGNSISVDADQVVAGAYSHGYQAGWAAVGRVYVHSVGGHEIDSPPVGLVDTATGRWHLRTNGRRVHSFFYGNPGDVPFVGDWDCNGIDTPGLFRQSDAFAYLRNSNTQGNADIRFFFGNPSDVPLAGDWDGDGCDTLSIYRPSEQRFYIVNALGASDGGLGAADFSFVFGNPGDKPVVGDWNGDGVDEVGLHRESTGFFYWRNTLDTGIASGQIYFGDPGDRFLAGDWGIVDGVDTPAVFRPGDTAFYFRHTLTQGVADRQFDFGRSSWLPVAGAFGLG